MSTINSLLGFASLLVETTFSHSWLECTDYDITVDIDSDDFLNDYYGSNGFDFHPGCKGYARDRRSCGNTRWDTCGLAFQPPLNDFQMCRDDIGNPSNGYSSTYNAQYPMAQYRVGNRYRLLWPAKNHAGYECQGDQRDNEMQLWVNLNESPTQDIDAFVSGETLYSEMAEAGYTLVIDWHVESGQTFALRKNNEFDESVYGEVYDNVGIDGIPFQNCPHFCDDMDDAVCYGDFDLPNIFPRDGYYTFVWWWEFKSHEKYSHCYEAYVTGATPQTDSPTPRPTTSSPTDQPTEQPTEQPTTQPTDRPTEQPTRDPNGATQAPSSPTLSPTDKPSLTPTTNPTSDNNINTPTINPSVNGLEETTSNEEEGEGEGEGQTTEGSNDNGDDNGEDNGDGEIIATDEPGTDNPGRLNTNNKDNDDDSLLIIIASAAVTGLVCCVIIAIVVFCMLKRNKEPVIKSPRLAAQTAAQSTMANIVAVDDDDHTDGPQTSGPQISHISHNNAPGVYGGGHARPATNGMTTNGRRAPPPPPPKRFY